jgi:hypothetical protein
VADGLGEGHHRRLGEDPAVRQAQVRGHPRLVHGQSLEHVCELRGETAGEDERLREGEPLHCPGGHVSLARVG